MRKIAIIFLCLCSLVACKNTSSKKPIWLNEQPIIFAPAFQLKFKSDIKNWHAVLLSFSQPILLAIRYEDSNIVASLQNQRGIIEGAAQICLYTNDTYFYYPVNLQNKSFIADDTKDYRSPKTVNPDSSLLQQSILHKIDNNRNLVYSFDKKEYFFEKEISLLPNAGIFRALKDKPISAFYLLPGTCTSIPLNGKYNAEKNIYKITAGPLKDKYNNTVADGTLVSFIYTNNNKTYRMESTLLNGFAYINIPSDNKIKYQLRAEINDIVSKTIHILL